LFCFVSKTKQNKSIKQQTVKVIKRTTGFYPFRWGPST